MKSIKKATILSTFLLIFLYGCSNSPGPLEGVWQANGLLPMKIAFRPGETETLGMIEHVEYKVDGKNVTVTYKDGPMKGVATSFTLTDPDTATNTLLTLKRIR